MDQVARAKRGFETKNSRSLPYKKTHLGPRVRPPLKPVLLAVLLPPVLLLRQPALKVVLSSDWRRLLHLLHVSPVPVPLFAVGLHRSSSGNPCYLFCWVFFGGGRQCPGKSKVTSVVALYLHYITRIAYSVEYILLVYFFKLHLY